MDVNLVSGFGDHEIAIERDCTRRPYDPAWLEFLDMKTQRIARKFRRAKRGLQRLYRAREELAIAKRRVDELVAFDTTELARREQVRALLAGAWTLTRNRDWFDAPEQRDRFMAWMKDNRTRSADVRLFEPGADDDLLTPERLAALAAEKGLGDLFGSAAPATESVPASELRARVLRRAAVRRSNSG